MTALTLTTPDGTTLKKASWAQHHFAQAVIESRAKVCAMFGGIGSGKTAIGVKLCWRMATVEALGAIGMIVTPSFRTFQQSTLPEIRKHWPKTGWKLHHPGGFAQITITHAGKESVILIRSVKDARTVEEMRGPTLAWIWGDEAATWHMGSYAWDLAIGRLRGVLDDRPNFMPRMFLTGSPRWGWLNKVFGIKGKMPPHAWTTGFYSKYNVKNPQPENAFYVRASRTSDNAYNWAGYEQFMRDNYSQAFYEQEVKGDFIAPTGAVYPRFYPDVHVINHALAMELFRESRYKIGGVDWGFNNAAMSAMGINKDGRIVIVREWQKPRYEAEDMIPIARKWEDELGITDWWPDTNNKGAIQKWQGKYRRIRGVRGKVHSKTVKDVADSRDSVRFAMRVESGMSHPAYPDDSRRAGTFLYMSSKCPMTADQHQALRYGDVKEGEEQDESDTTPANDHLCDAVRYPIHNHMRKREVRTSWQPGL